MSTTQITELQAQINKLREEAADQVRNPVWRAEQAAILAEDINEGFLSHNLVDLLTIVKRVGRNETLTFRSTKGLQAYHVSRGGYIEESVLTSDIDYIRKDQIGFHVVEHLDRLEVNFYESADAIVRLGTMRLDAEINRRVFKTFEAAVGIGDDNYFGVSGLSFGALNDALAYVEDQPVTSQGTLDKPIIVTRTGMNSKIRDLLTQNNSYGAYLPVTNEALTKRGVVGEYMGHYIVTLKNYLDENDLPFFPNNEIWVVGQDAAITGFFGAPRPHDYVSQGEDYWHYINRLDYGVSVIHPERIARIVDSTVNP